MQHYEQFKSVSKSPIFTETFSPRSQDESSSILKFSPEDVQLLKYLIQICDLAKNQNSP